jgi:hypothetical protein
MGDFYVIPFALAYRCGPDVIVCAAYGHDHVKVMAFRSKSGFDFDVYMKMVIDDFGWGVSNALRVGQIP